MLLHCASTSIPVKGLTTAVSCMSLATSSVMFKMKRCGSEVRIVLIRVDASATSSHGTGDCNCSAVQVSRFVWPAKKRDHTTLASLLKLREAAYIFVPGASVKFCITPLPTTLFKASFKEKCKGWANAIAIFDEENRGITAEHIICPFEMALAEKSSTVDTTGKLLKPIKTIC